MPDEGRRPTAKTSKAKPKPKEPTRAKAPRRRAPLAAEAAEDSRVVLVVDDQDDVREGLRLSLSLEGWKVEEASSGDEAIEQWRRTSPDVVLLDQRLGGMSGLECAAHLRSMSSDTRIILVTAHLDDWATKEARRLRLLPLAKTDHKRLFELLAVLAEQIRAAKKTHAV